MGELNEGYTSHRGIRMALSALKMFAPYSGDAASAPGGRGNGAANRIAIWQDGNTLTSLSGITANLSTGVVGITASGSALEVGANASGTSTANIIGAFRKDQNGNTTLSISNQDTGSGANAKLILASSLGNLDFLSSSTAGGAITQINSGSAFTGGLEINQLGANPIKLKTNGTTALTISSSQAATFASTVLATSGLYSSNGTLQLNNAGTAGLACLIGTGVNSGQLSLTGDTAAGTGANIEIYAGSHASAASEIRFRKDTTVRLTIDGNGNIVCGAAALATNATDGFIYMPSCAGTPSGTPTSKTGRVAFAYDTTNNKIYIYNGAWKATAALT